MTLRNLIKVSTMGGVMLMGLNLLSQPAQAIKVGFSFANLNGDSPTGADQLVTGTIDGLIEGNNSGAGVTATVLSTPTGEYLGDYSFGNINGGSPNAFIVTGGNITFADAVFLINTNDDLRLLTFLSAGVSLDRPNGFSQLNDHRFLGFLDDTQPATFTATPVPWETDALPVIGSTILVIGSTILFAGGLWAKSKFAKP
jgi:hypothetical protein